MISIRLPLCAPEIGSGKRTTFVYLLLPDLRAFLGDRYLLIAKRSGAIQANAGEAHHRRERVVVPVEMQNAEASLGRSCRDEIVGRWKSSTTAQVSRGTKSSGTHGGGDGRLRKRRKSAVERLEAGFVARAGKDLKCCDRTDGDKPGCQRCLPTSDDIDISLSNPGRRVDDERDARAVRLHWRRSPRRDATSAAAPRS